MFTAKELAENSHVQDAFVIAVEQQLCFASNKKFFKKRAYETTLYLESLGWSTFFWQISLFICLFWYVYSKGTGRKQPRTGCFCHCCWTTGKREAGKAVSSSQNQTSGHDQTFTAGTTTSLLLVRYYLVVTMLHTVSFWTFAFHKKQGCV